MVKILLIAGHGGKDSGAVGNGYREADLTRETVGLIQTMMRKYCVCDVADTSIDWFEYLGSNSYNFKEYDYVLEVHFNSGGGTGTEIYVTTNTADTGLASQICAGAAGALGIRNRGLKTSNFRVISRVSAQGVGASLLEVCFIDSAADVAAYQERKNAMAAAVVKAIASWFGLRAEPGTEAIAELEKRVAELENTVYRPMIYNYIDDNMPQWAREAVAWCVNNGIIIGTGDGLGLDDQKLWSCVTLYRLAMLMQKDGN